MKQRRSLVPMVALFAVVSSAAGWRVAAQSGRIINFPGVGPIDLDQLPPELQNNLALPGERVARPEPESRDLPPIANQEPEEILPEDVVSPPPDDSYFPENDIRETKEYIEAQRKSQEQYEEYRRWHEGEASKDSQRSANVPDDAYLKAFRTMERLGGQQETSRAPMERQSMVGRLKRVLGLGSSRAAYASAPACSNAPAWVPVGPAGYSSFFGSVGQSGTEGAGIVKAIALDRTSGTSANPPSKVYVGTRDGGLWQTTSGGGSWTTTTDNLSSPNVTSLQIEAIAVSATTPNVILAGTGLGSKSNEYDLVKFSKSIGTLRSTDTGTAWSQIGPTWCASSDAQCYVGGTCISSNPGLCTSTDPTQSTINVKEVTIDDRGWAWIATTKGLWKSINALTATTPGGVTWTRIQMSSPTTGPLNRGDGSPDWVNHAFISGPRGASSVRTLYVSVIPDTSAESLTVPTHRGWYKSTDDGGSWVQINGTGINVLPSVPLLQRAAVAFGVNDTIDTLYSIISSVSSSQCGANQVRERVYKTSNSGAGWALTTPSGTCEGTSCNSPVCDCCLSIQVDPANPARVVAGGTELYYSIDGWASATRISKSDPDHNFIHGDQNALIFDANNPARLYVGNDGGAWRADLTSVPPAAPVWTNLHGNLANLEFFFGSVDGLNYGVSAGGLQDNGSMRGGTPLLWTAIQAGDGGKVLVDPRDSNAYYFAEFGTIQKSTDGGAIARDISVGLPNPASTVANTLAIDPGDTKSVIIFSFLDHRMYRTTTGGDSGWSPISQAFTFDATTSATVPSVTGNTRSSWLYLGGAAGIWQTQNAVSWSRIDVTAPPQLPARSMTSIAIDTTQQQRCGDQLCSAFCPCTLYATFDLFNNQAPAGHIFYSPDSGQHWQDIGGGSLPDVPAHKVVIDPACSNTIYVATEMGIYRAIFNNGVCLSPNTQT